LAKTEATRAQLIGAIELRVVDGGGRASCASGEGHVSE
jgi:hypothetical protein